MRAGTKGWWLGLVLAGSLLAPARAQQGFTQIGTLPDSFFAHRLEAAGGALYHIGGIGGLNGVFDADKIYMARITSPGHLGPWTAVAPLPALVFYHASAVWNNTLYVIGGYEYGADGSFAISNAVLYSHLDADGVPGAWVHAASLPKSLYLHSAAVSNGVIYVSGGWSDDGQTSGVYGGRILPDGAIASWTPLTPLPTGIYAHTTVRNNTIYVLGGIVDNGARMQNNVYFAPILADKTLGSWQDTTPLPEPVANHVSELIGGRIWSLAGWTYNGPTTAVHSATILADNSLGAWRSEPGLPVAVFEHAATVVDDGLYVSGGLDPDNNNRNEIWYLPPSAPPAPIDQLPPRTNIAWQGPNHGSGPLFVSRDTTLSLSATDDRSAVGDGLGVGVASTQWAQGEGSFGPYSAPFKLSAEGAYPLRYFSTDLAGHQEPAGWLAVALDLTPPASTLAIGSPKAILSSTRTIVAASTLLAVSAADPTSSGVASGIADVLAAIDGGALSASAGVFTLPAVDGAHAVLHQARDQVGNLEALVTETVYVDNTPPATALSADPAPYSSADGPILGAAGLLRFSAQDPVAGGVAAGVNATLCSLDGGPAVPAAGSLALSEGAHTLQYRSVDNVGNAETWKSAAYRLDATAPATTLTVGSPVMRLDGLDVVTPATPLTLSAVDPQSAGVASGVRLTTYRIDAGSESDYSGAFQLPVGSHIVSYHSVDNAGNVEPERTVTFTVQAMDALPPRTSYAITGTSWGAEPVFVSPAATFSLAAADDRSSVGDAAGVGVAATSWAFDAQAFATYQAALAAPAEGLHWLRFYSADQAGNIESAQALQVAVDGTLPVSSVDIGSPKAVLAGGQVIVASTTLLWASASDPVSAGVASGIAQLLAAVDEAPLAPSAGTFSLPAVDGAHVVKTRAADRVGNVEAVRSLTVLLDRTAPLSALTPSAAPYAGSILNAAATLTFSASDPVTGGVAAGVHHTEYSLDGAAATPVTGTLVLAEGAHAIGFGSVDNVGNGEAWKQAAYSVDATAPATTLTIGSPVMRLDGLDVVTPATPLTLSAVDPQSAGVASGVRLTTYRIDAGSESDYSGAFQLPVGSHIVSYHSVDNAGNVETERSVAFAVQADDSFPPRTALAWQGPSFGSEPLFVAPSTRFSLSAVDDRQAAGDAAGVGVAATSWAFDAEPFAAYAGPIPTAAEGAHWFRFYSVDKAGNAEAAQAVRVAVDRTAPVSSLAIGAPQATLASGQVIVAPGTRLAVSAEDPVAAGVAAGVAQTRIGIDGGALASQVGEFALPATDGSHTVSHQAVDAVGNEEAPASATILMDGTSPVTTVSVSPAPYVAADGVPFLAASSELTLAAEDPAVNGASAGIARTDLALDGAAPAAPGAALKLAEGEHLLRVRSVDNVGNAEAWREARYRVDATAPLTSLETGAPVMRLTGEDVLTPETPVTLSAEDPVSAGVASGVGATSYRVDDGGEQAYRAPFQLPIGRHTVRYRSIDNAGNAEQERSAAFTVEALDRLPPRTTIAVIGAHAGADPMFVRPDTSFSLAAVDDRLAAGDAAGVGVAATRWAFDDGDFAAYAAAFPAPASGAHWLRYTSADLLGNAEAAVSMSLAVDGTAPVSRLHTGAPQALLESGEVVIASHTLLSASAVDPTVDGVASGVASLLVAVDGGEFMPAAATFRLPAVDGAHTVLHRATDNLGSAEAARSETFYVDQTPPATTVSVTPLPYASAQGPILAATALLTFSATDPAVNGTAAGVHHTEFSLDGAAATAGGALALEEGSHVVEFRSIDNVGNAEVWLHAAYAVDATPPLTTLETGSPVIRLFGRDIVTSATPLSLSAQDPVSAGVASGVGTILYAVDAGAEQAYAGPFHLPSGPHTVTYRSIDNAGNSEEARAAGFEVGTFPTDSIAALDSVTLNGGASVTGQVRANGAFTAGGKSTVTGDVTAATVDLSGKSTVSGTIARTPGTVSSMDAAALHAAAAANNDNASVPWLADGSLVLTAHAARTLPAGSYFLSALQLSGGASLSVSGPVNLFVAGPISVTGGATVNETGSANDLWIFTDGTEAKVAGGARWAAHLIAPNAAVAFSGGGAVAGRVLGWAVSLSGNAAHPSDSALPALVRSPGQAKKLAKTSAHSGGTASKGRGHGGEETVVSSRLAAELPPAAGVSRAQAAAPSPREALPAPAATPSMLAASAKRAASAPQGGKPEAVVAAKVSAAGPAVRQARLETAAPAAATKGTASAGTPPVERERLPKPPRSEGGVRERSVHEAHAEPAARPKPAPATTATLASHGAVEAAELHRAEPKGKAWGHESAGTPVPADQLPAAPRGRPVLASFEHKAEPTALPRRAAELDGGTAGPATAEGLAQPVRAAHLDAAQPRAERTGARAPRLEPPARREPSARRIEARMPPLMTARLAALSIVTPGRTGAVRSGARHAVLVPEGAVKASLALTVSTERQLDDGERERRDRSAERKEATAVGQAVAYGPEGTRFDKPVTLELAYDRAQLPAGVGERALAIHYWNPRSGEWEALASVVDVQAQIVRAKTDHFSTYQLLATPAPVAGGPAAPGALLGDVYPFPNPVRPGQTAKLRVLSTADRVEVRIYDMAGELKHSAAYDHPAAELDHVWDLSGIGSGVYVYSVTASRAGERPARARGKVGVIR